MIIRMATSTPVDFRCENCHGDFSKHSVKLLGIFAYDQGIVRLILRTWQVSQSPCVHNVPED